MNFYRRPSTEQFHSRPPIDTGTLRSRRQGSVFRALLALPRAPLIHAVTLLRRRDWLEACQPIVYARTHGIPEDQVVADILLKESAIKRLVEPEEVAALVGWLASPTAGMVTAASYTMDGGWSAR